MNSMFLGAKYFNEPIGDWNVYNVTSMTRMFFWCKDFNQDISSWDVSKVKYFNDIFYKCKIEEKYKPKFS